LTGNEMWGIFALVVTAVSGVVWDWRRERRDDKAAPITAATAVSASQAELSQTALSVVGMLREEVNQLLGEVAVLREEAKKSRAEIAALREQTDARDVLERNQIRSLWTRIRYLLTHIDMLEQILASEVPGCTYPQLSPEARTLTND